MRRWFEKSTGVTPSVRCGSRKGQARGGLLPLVLALVLAGWGPDRVAGQPGSGDRQRGPEPYLLQAAADSMSLTLEACVQRALQVGEEIRQAEATRQTAHARYLQARSTALPQVTLTTTYTRQLESIFQGGGDSESMSFEPDTLASWEQRVRDLEDALPTSGFLAIQQLLSSSSFASENSWISALSIRQRLLQGGSIIGSIRAAGHALDAAGLALRDREAEVIRQVREVYLDALLARQGVRIGRLGLEQAETQLQRVRLRQEAGHASEYELLGAEVQRDNAIPPLRAAEMGAELADLRLRQICNLPASQPVRLVSPLLDVATLATGAAPVDTVGLEAAALAQAGVRALEEMLAARGNAVTVARAGYFPDIAAFGNFSQQAFPPDAWPRRRDWRRDQSVGLKATMSHVDGVYTYGAVHEAKAQLTAARQELGQARELVRLAVRQGALEAERAAAELQARSRTVQLARRALDLAGLRYEEGAADALEVQEARAAWQMALTHEAQARRDYFVALAQLERYTGRPLFKEAAPIDMQ